MTSSERASIILNLLVMLTNDQQPRLETLIEHSMSESEALNEHSPLLSGITIGNEGQLSVSEDQIGPVLMELAGYSGPVVVQGMNAKLEIQTNTMQFNLNIISPEGQWFITETDPELLSSNLRLVRRAVIALRETNHLKVIPKGTDRPSEEDTRPPPKDQAAEPQQRENKPEIQERDADPEEAMQRALSAEALEVAQRLASSDGVTLSEYVNELILFQE